MCYAEFDEIIDKLRLARADFPDERIWANPDCGLKTRGYAEVKKTLQHLVEAVQEGDRRSGTARTRPAS